ncbi:diacylglycerol/lipid kinase family protein [Sinomicrobium oceani]|uniref:diacylglycerol/lipid kinase family protein n=1 Tax=Sinomicrobium oceani TaxID=1150368 RepID=UPI00227D5BA4|nr:diacylglycerol kinase family protein [Sinomicrobium oceani]
MKNIHFIVNPIAGRGNNGLDNALLDTYFPGDAYLVVVKYSERKKHAIALAIASLKEGASVIVACGGDGTVNEVASVLVNTDIPLGIIPLGSGNGLASHLKIPADQALALDIIKKQLSARIDVGCCNGAYFFSNTGVGFDAEVIRNYEGAGSRKLTAYTKACIKAFFGREKACPLEVSVDGGKYYKDPYLIFISNSNEMGYSFSLTPGASLQDGLLDVLIVPNMNKIRFLLFGILMLFKKHVSLKGVVNYQTRQLRLNRNDHSFFGLQMDGEYKILPTGVITIELLHAALSVISGSV